MTTVETAREEPAGADEAFVLPMSFAQQRLWFLDQLEPGCATYNLPFNFRLAGPLDADALRDALAFVVERHEVLRTVFDASGREPMQVILPPAGVELPATDLRALDDADREAEVGRRVQHEAARPFDLANGPVWRAALLRTGAEEHVLVLTIHHVAVDGWSFGVLQREIAAAYGAIAAGRDPDLPPLEIQYGDFASWQQAQFGDGALDAQLAYWRRQLAGPLAVLDLPTDRPRTPDRDRTARTVAVHVPADVTAALLALAREAEVTPFVLLLAAYQALLHRYTGQDDVIVGSPVAGRTRRETEALVGLFVNTLAVRADLSGAPSFRTLLARVRESAHGALAHEDVPFERVVNAVQPERHLAHNPIFQTLFSFQDFAPPVSPTAGGVTFTRVGGARTTAKFDLQLIMGRRGDELHGTLEYDASLFDDATARRLARHFGALLRGAAAAPDRRVGELPLLDDAERRQLGSWSAGPRAEYAGGATLVERLAAQAARTPNAPAVSDARRMLTYAELDAAAAALARRLRRSGVGPGARVGVCAERSVELVVALVAVLKAGGAYVPLDPEYPRERLAFMVDDANAAFVLATRAAAAALPPDGAPVVELDGVAEPGADSSSDDEPLPLPAPDDPAYVIYTSGSTGRPKGALNAHRGIVNRLAWMQEEYRLTPADVVLQKTPAGFDVSVWEFFWPLLAGAHLVLARPGEHRDPHALAAAIAAHGVTVCHFVPSMLRAFLADPAAARCTTLRDVVASGEALPPDLVAAFYRTLPGALLHNLYGPTECAVDVSAWPCPPSPEPPAIVPIGRPVANTRLYVLDAGGQLAPVGLPGELHIAGVQVGLGYHARPELTAERFVRDPFAGEGAKMYRTGDRARWRDDGALEYLGRLDDQVKLRGVRIELGEVEAALVAHTDVAAAAAAVRGEAGADQQLVGYYVVREGRTLDAAALRAHLRERLPDAMVPGALVALAELPIGPTGKLARAALPAPAAAVAESGRAYVPTVGNVEHDIVSVWEELLGASPIGRHDDFFELGGHSLLAVRMLADVAERTGRRLPLAALFDGATVHQLGRRIEAAVRDEDEPPVVVLQGDGTGTPFALVHGDFLAGGWYTRRLAPLLGADTPLLVLPTPRTDDEVDGRSVEALAAEHVATLRAVQPHGPYRIGGFCAAGLIAFEIARQLRASGEAVERLVLIDTEAGNARFRWLEPLIRLASRADDARERQNRRATVLRHLRYYSMRLRAVRRDSARERWRWLTTNIERRLSRRAAATEVLAGLTTNALLAAQPSVDTLSPIVRLTSAYLPRTYPGTVDLVVASDLAGVVRHEPRVATGGGVRELRRGGRRGWERVARAVRVHIVRGSHTGLVTDELPALAERLAAILGPDGDDGRA
ncbi:hypothetical protein tb265_44310 [Gemmatimonadetes bacterium T265]|nr:hypothetical protein tb265_44310 [Gemmatimonadetes bacterium T265]